jgi:hypothetical protein
VLILSSGCGCTGVGKLSQGPANYNGIGDIMNKKILFFTLGFALVIIGITLTLRDWLFLVMLFRGVCGPILAIGGLVVLTLCKD